MWHDLLMYWRVPADHLADPFGTNGFTYAATAYCDHDPIGGSVLVSPRIPGILVL